LVLFLQRNQSRAIGGEVSKIVVNLAPIGLICLSMKYGKSSKGWYDQAQTGLGQPQQRSLTHGDAETLSVDIRRDGVV